MISKELASEVLGIDILNINYIPNDKDTISSNEGYFVITKDGTPNINIHELAYKCKEWAYEKSYHIDTLKSHNSKYWASVTGFCALGHQFSIDDCSTEPESIFKACQWILDNKKENI